MINKIIGAVSVNKPQKHHNNSYETAAWWEDTVSETGVFPVYLRQGHHYPHHLYVDAKVPSKVVDDYFPGLWGGVPFSKEPYKAKHIGESRTMVIHIELAEAIAKTGRIPGDELDWYINPEHWHLALEEAKTELESQYECLQKHWDMYKAGHDASTLGYCGNAIGKWSKVIDEVTRHMKYIGIVPGENESSIKRWVGYLNENTKWVEGFRAG